MMKRALTLSLAVLFLAAVLWTSVPLTESALAAPAAPSGFQVSSYSASQINLSWNAVSGATSYQVYRSTGTSSSYIRIAIITSRAYIDTDLKPATRYNYKVRAVKSGSVGSFTAVKTAYTRPTTPTGLAAKTVSTSQIDLSWTAVTGATSYQVYRSTGTSTAYAKIATVATPKYSDKGRSAGTRYNYKVRAVNSGGVGGFSAVKTTYTKPATPTGLAAKTVSTSQIDLSWSAVTGATSYQVYRSYGTSTSYAKIATVTTPKYSDKGRSAGTRYNYKVLAANAGGAGGSSAVKTAYTKPSTPTGLAAKTISTSQIDLSWTAVTGATSYHVYRSTGTSTSYTRIATVTTPKYSDKGRAAGTRYNYKVLAANAGGASGSSAVKTAYTKPATPTGLTAKTISTSQIDLSWTTVTGATSYQVYCSTGTSTTYTKIATVTTPKYSDKGRAAGIRYNYKVLAANAGGASGYSTVKTAYTKPAAPTGVTATKVSESQIRVQWNAVAGATGYRLFISTNGGNYVVTDMVSGSTRQYDDTGLSFGTYSYKVSALLNGVESTQSAATSAITLAEPAYTIEDGRYRVVNAATGLYLNGFSDASINKDKAWWVIATAGDGSQEQIFTFQRQSDGTYKITIEKYGRVLTADGGTFSGANMIIAPDSGTANQRFVLTKKNGDAYCITPVGNKDTAIEQTDKQAFTGFYATELASLIGGSRQQWRFEKIPEETYASPVFPINVVDSSIGDYSGDIDVNNVYAITYGGNPSYYVDGNEDYTSGHYGTDYRAIDMSFENCAGKSIMSIEDGVVLRIRPSTGAVYIKHTVPLKLHDGSKIYHTWYSVYLHMSDVTVNTGDVVTKGTVIGKLSKVGAKEYHLHFSITTRLYNGNDSFNYTYLYPGSKDKSVLKEYSNATISLYWLGGSFRNVKYKAFSSDAADTSAIARTYAGTESAPESN